MSPNVSLSGSGIGVCTASKRGSSRSSISIRSFSYSWSVSLGVSRVLKAFPPIVTDGKRSSFAPVPRSSGGGLKSLQLQLLAMSRDKDTGDH